VTSRKTSQTRRWKNQPLKKSIKKKKATIIKKKSTTRPKKKRKMRASQRSKSRPRIRKPSPRTLTTITRSSSTRLKIFRSRKKTMRNIPTSTSETILLPSELRLHQRSQLPRSSQLLLRAQQRVQNKKLLKLLPKSLLKNNPQQRNLRRRKLLELVGRERESLFRKHNLKRKKTMLSRNKFKFTSMHPSTRNKKTSRRIHLKMKTL